MARKGIVAALGGVAVIGVISAALLIAPARTRLVEFGLWAALPAEDVTIGHVGVSDDFSVSVENLRIALPGMTVAVRRFEASGEIWGELFEPRGPLDYLRFLRIRDVTAVVDALGPEIPITVVDFHAEGLDAALGGAGAAAGPGEGAEAGPDSGLNLISIRLGVRDEIVDVAIATAAGQTLAAGHPIPLSGDITSKHFNGRFLGRISDLAGGALEGKVTVDAADFGRLLTWLADAPAADLGSASLATEISAGAESVNIKNLAIAVGGIDLDGGLELRFSGDRTRLDGAFSLSRLDVEGLIAMAGKLAPPEPEAETDFDAPIDVSALESLDGEIDLAVETIRLGPFASRETVRGKLAFGERMATFTVEPLALLGGHVGVAVGVASEDGRPRLSATLELTDLSLASALTDAFGFAEVPGGAAGTVGARLALAAEGGSAGELIGSLDLRLAAEVSQEGRAANVEGPGGANLDLSLTLRDDEVRLGGTAVLNARPVRLTVALPRLKETFLEGAVQEVDVSAAVEADGFHVSLEGSDLDPAMETGEVAVAVAVEDVRDFAGWLGLVSPSASAGAKAAFALEGTIKLEGPVRRFDGGVLRLGGHSGTVGIVIDATEPIIKATGSIELPALDLTPYLSALEAEPETPGPAPADHGALAPYPGGPPIVRARFVDETAAPLAAADPESDDDLAFIEDIKTVAGDFSIRLGGLRAGRFSLGPTVARARLGEGKLELDLEGKSVFGGDVKGGVSLVATELPYRLGADLRITNLLVADMLETVGGQGGAQGVGAGGLSLTATGVNSAEMIRTATVKGEIVFDDVSVPLPGVGSTRTLGERLANLKPGAGEVVPDTLTVTLDGNARRGTVSANWRRGATHIGLVSLTEQVEGRPDAEGRVNRVISGRGRVADVIRVELSGLYNRDSASILFRSGELDAVRLLKRLEAPVLSEGTWGVAGQFENSAGVPELNLDIIAEGLRFAGPAAPDRVFGGTVSAFVKQEGPGTELRASLEIEDFVDLRLLGRFDDKAVDISFKTDNLDLTEVPVDTDLVSIGGKAQISGSARGAPDALNLAFEAVLDNVLIKSPQGLHRPLRLSRIAGDMILGEAGPRTLNAGLQVQGMELAARLAVDGDSARLAVEIPGGLDFSRIGELLALRGLSREVRTAVQRQLRRGRIEKIVLSADCPARQSWDCFSRIGDPAAVRAEVVVHDVALAPFPRAPSLSISALELRVENGIAVLSVSDARAPQGNRVTAAKIDISGLVDLSPTAEGTISLEVPDIRDVASLLQAGGFLGELPATLTGGLARIDVEFSAAAETGLARATVSAEIVDLAGQAGPLGPFTGGEIRVRATAEDNGELATLEIGRLVLAGTGWRAEVEGEVSLLNDVPIPRISGIITLDAGILGLAPRPPPIVWTGDPVIIGVKLSSPEPPRYDMSFRIDGAKACFSLKAETVIRIKDCGESLEGGAHAVLDPATGEVEIDGLGLKLDGHALITGGGARFGESGLTSEIKADELNLVWLAGRIEGAPLALASGQAELAANITPQGWRAELGFHDVTLEDSSGGPGIRAGGSVRVNPERLDIAAEVLVSGGRIERADLSGTIHGALGPEPRFDLAVGIPALDLRDLPVTEQAPEAAGTSDAAPAPPAAAADAQFRALKDVVLPGSGEIRVEIDSVLTTDREADVSRLTGKAAWNGLEETLSLDWKRGNAALAGVFARRHRENRLDPFRFEVRAATDQIPVAYLSRWLLGQPVGRKARARVVSLDLAGMWGAPLKALTGSFDIEAVKVSLPEASLLMELYTEAEAQRASESGDSGETGGRKKRGKAKGAKAIAGVGFMDLEELRLRGRLANGRLTLDPLYLRTSLGDSMGSGRFDLYDGSYEGFAVIKPLNGVAGLLRHLPGIGGDVESLADMMKFAFIVNGNLEETEVRRPGDPAELQRIVGALKGHGEYIITIP